MPLLALLLLGLLSAATSQTPAVDGLYPSAFELGPEDGDLSLDVNVSSSSSSGSFRYWSPADVGGRRELLTLAFDGRNYSCSIPVGYRRGGTWLLVSWVLRRSFLRCSFQGLDGRLYQPSLRSFQRSDVPDYATLRVDARASGGNGFCVDSLRLGSEGDVRDCADFVNASANFRCGCSLWSRPFRAPFPVFPDDTAAASDATTEAATSRITLPPTTTIQTTSGDSTTTEATTASEATTTSTSRMVDPTTTTSHITTPSTTTTIESTSTTTITTVTSTPITTTTEHESSTVPTSATTTTVAPSTTTTTSDIPTEISSSSTTSSTTTHKEATTTLVTTLPPVTASTNTTTAEPTTISPTCFEEDGDEFECLNDGQCQSSPFIDARCLCVGNYIGRNCAFVDMCTEFAPCLHGGGCTHGDVRSVASNVTRNDSYTCHCVDDWTGENCESRLTSASPTSTGITSKRPPHPPSTANPKNCIQDVEDGEWYTCLNGACRDHVNGTSSCLCDDDYSGRNCAFKNPCVRPSPCGHGGKCFTDEASAKLESVTKNATFVCECAGFWSGPACAEAVWHMAPGAVAGIVFAVLAGLALAVAAVYATRYVRRSRRLKGKYNPAREEIQAGNANSIQMSPIKKGERLI